MNLHNNTCIVRGQNKNNTLCLLNLHFITQNFSNLNQALFDFDKSDSKVFLLVVHLIFAEFPHLPSVLEIGGKKPLASGELFVVQTQTEFRFTIPFNVAFM